MIRYWILQTDGKWRYGAAPTAEFFGDVVLAGYNYTVGARVYIEFCPRERGSDSYEILSDTAPEGAPVFDK